MSKTNQNKKLITNNSSPYLLPQNKQKIKDTRPNTHLEKIHSEQKTPSNEQLGPYFMWKI